VPLDRNAKVRVMMVPRALMRHQEKGKAYGKISAKALAVLTALLWRFHNAATGKCFPRHTRRSPRPPGLRSASSAFASTSPGLFRQPGATTLRGAGSPAALSVGWPLARLAGKAVSGGHRQIKPREPRRPQPDATTLRGSANFAFSPGR
jgi:hypothetical protein